MWIDSDGGLVPNIHKMGIDDELLAAIDGEIRKPVGDRLRPRTG